MGVVAEPPQFLWLLCPLRPRSGRPECAQQEAGGAGREETQGRLGALC